MEVGFQDQSIVGWPNMRISYFREFITLSKYLNFSLAAKHLHMTQPGLSRHIARLEDEVGIKLFTRDTHQVKLTENGEQFLRGITKIVDDYDFLCESVTKGGLKKITIGVPYYGVNKYLSPVMGLFESAHAKVKIDYLPAYPDEIITGLLSMTVDVAVLPMVAFLRVENLAVHDLFNEPIVLMLNRNHPLAKKKGVKFDHLKNENFIFLKGNWGDALFQDLCGFCRQRGFAPPKKAKETDTIEAAALYMKPDTGVMLLPEHLREATISENVKCINITDKDCYLTVSLVHHPDNPNPIIEKFIRHYQKQVGQDK
jgi:DNA-binding transcriptional LysR family regulator